jgi:enamine deaminase RidA (YjgF/YER057c/UK114 family)
VADLALPPSPVPQGRYVPAVVHNGIAYSAGMTPRIDGALALTGRVGDEVSVDQASAAAGIAARNALAAVVDAAGGRANVMRCLRMTVYVAAADGFTQHSQVADGASNALAGALGTSIEFVRSAIGVASLPAGAPVEVELTAAIAPP